MFTKKFSTNPLITVMNSLTGNCFSNSIGKFISPQRVQTFMHRKTNTFPVGKTRMLKKVKKQNSLENLDGKVLFFSLSLSLFYHLYYFQELFLEPEITISGRIFLFSVNSSISVTLKEIRWGTCNV